MRYAIIVGFLLSLALPYIPRPVPHHAPTINTSQRRWSDVALYYISQRLAEVTAQLNAVTADRDAKVAEIAQKDQTIAALEASSSGIGGAVHGTAVVGNHFPWGYCTWYVATRRYIPWYGNANEWLINAQRYGYATGSIPRIGAVLVENLTVYGHVAYVESLSPLIVSEANYRGWGLVDTRRITSSDPILGYVY